VLRRLLQRMQRLYATPRVRQGVHSLALGLLIASVATAAIKLSRWQPRASIEHARTSAAAKRKAPSLEHDQRLVPVEPEPERNDVRTSAPSESGLAPVLSASGSTLTPSASAPPPALSAPESALTPGKYRSPSELFADAKQARAAGDKTKAIAISRLLEETFPSSPEGITTHLSLGVLYLEQGQPALALQEYKIYRHIGSSLVMAEALWGEQQALQQLGRTSEERAVLEELLSNYPHSVYVAAAEQRLAALNH
jgi:tetratricopeptide (TPR) repeat protein